MNIKDFLIDNYIYILIVIGLIIITIIGFLADKKNKKGGSNKDIAPSNNANMGNVNYNNMTNQGQPMNYQPNIGDNNNQPINNTLLNNNIQQPVSFNQMPNNVINPVNNALNNDNVNMTMNVGQVSNNSLNNDGLNMNNINNNDGNLNVLPGTMQGSIITSNNNNPVNVQPVENILQQPIIPQSIPNVQPVVPQVVEPLNTDNSNMSDAMYQPLVEQKPVFGPTDVSTNIQNYNQGMPMNSMNNFNQINVDNNVVGTVPMDVNNGMIMNNNSISNNGFVANNITNNNPVVIPNPTVPQQPVTPIPPVINTPPVTIPNQPAGNVTIPNQVTTPQPVNVDSLNFVYGQQPTNPNNNGFMQ